MNIKENRTCALCPEIFRVLTKSNRKTCCTEHSRLYANSKWVRDQVKARQNTPEAKAKEKARRDTPEYKARLKARRDTPEYKAREKARRDTPEAKARLKARQNTPEYKARIKTNSNHQYLCKVCDGIFDIKIQLKNHMEKHRI